MSIPSVQIGESRTSPAPTPKEKEVVFVSEGVFPDPNGFRIAFSFWNNKETPIKLFSITSVEHFHEDSVAYYGGPRHLLDLTLDGEKPWNNETYEIPSRESASFDGHYTRKWELLDRSSKTKRSDALTSKIEDVADGRPWIVLGILAHFHDSLGNTRIVHSDCVYLYAADRISMIPIRKIERLNDSNSFRHEIYASLLRALSNYLDFDRDLVIKLMRDDYDRGIVKLRSVAAQKGSDTDVQRISALFDRWMKITERELKQPLEKGELDAKNNIEEALEQESDNFGLKSFVDLCAL